MKKMLSHVKIVFSAWLFMSMGHFIGQAYEYNTAFESKEGSESGSNMKVLAETTKPRRIRQRFIVFDTENSLTENFFDASESSNIHNKRETERGLHAELHSKRSQRNREEERHTDLEFGEYRTLKRVNEFEAEKRKEKRNARRKENVDAIGLDSELLDSVLRFIPRNGGLDNSYSYVPAQTSSPSPPTAPPTMIPELETNGPTSKGPGSQEVKTPTASPLANTSEPTSIKSNESGYSKTPTASPLAKTSEPTTNKPTKSNESGDSRTPTYVPTPSTYSPTSSTYSPTTTTFSPTTATTYLPTYATYAPTPDEIQSVIPDSSTNPTALACPTALSKSETLRDDVRLFYDVILDDDSDSNNGILCIRLEYDDEGWLGFGFSPTGEMVGSSAVIGLPGFDDSIANPGKYNLDGKTGSLVAIMDGAQQTLLDATVRQEDGMTILEFGKILIEDDEEPIVVPGENTFIYAAATSNDLGYHGFKRGSLTLYLEES